MAVGRNAFGRTARGLAGRLTRVSRTEVLSDLPEAVLLFAALLPRDLLAEARKPSLFFANCSRRIL